MNEYNPDTWVIVELRGSSVKDIYYRVLAGWYGGYARGDSWKMSSGIVKIVDGNTHWEIHNDSGSVYFCVKDYEKMSNYTYSIYSNFAKQNSDEIAVTRVDIESILHKYLKT